MKELTFYELETSVDLKVIGTYPQGDGMIKGYNFDSLTSVDNFAEFKGRACDFIPDLRYKLNSKARPTDFLSGCLGAGGDLVVSERIHTLLAKYVLGPHQVFEASVESQKKPLGRFCRLHFLYTLEPEIEFKESIFMYGGKLLESIDSYDAYKSFREVRDPLGLTRTQKTVVSREKFGHFDLFVIGFFDQKVYVSERLKEELRDHDVTGITLKSTRHIIFI